jgi:hypothetical protein
MSAPRRPDTDRGDPLGQLLIEALKHPVQSGVGLVVVAAILYEPARVPAAWVWIAVTTVLATDLVAFGRDAIWLRRWRRHRAQERVLRVANGAGLCNRRGDAPRVRKVRRTPAGRDVYLRLPAGLSAADVARHADRLASDFHVQDCRVVTEGGNRCVLKLRERDPLAAAGLRWPLRDAASVSLWDPVPVGVGEDGEMVTLALPERNVLIGGEPGGGKSVCLSQLVAAAALDPSVRLVLLDGKQVELSVWAGCAERFVGPDGHDALDALRELQRDMDQRYATLLASGLRKVERGGELPLRVVVVDELAFYAAVLPKGEREEFAGLLRDLVARGRAAGIIALTATQKPSSDIVPTMLRDLFGVRWALRCSTPQASDTVLGQGWAAEGADASRIPGGLRGVGYVLAEGGTPTRLRSYYLSDDDLAVLAERAAALRGATAEEAERRAQPLLAPPTPPEPVVFDLRLAGSPVSLNDVGARSSGRMFQRRKKELEARIAEGLEDQHPELAFDRIEVTGRAVFATRRARRDEDNHKALLAKATGDALQIAGRLADDTPRHFAFGHLELAPDPGEPRTELRLVGYGARRRS